MAVCSGRRSRCQWRWNSRPQLTMWSAMIVVADPTNERAFQVILAKRYEKVQAFSADGPDQSFAVTVRLRRSHGCAQHPDPQASHTPV